MNPHLSSQEISAWTLGERSPEIHEHALNCSRCQAQLALFNATLLQFRKSAQNWAEEQCSSDAQMIGRIKQHSHRKMLNAFGWAATAMTASVLATFSIRENPTAPSTRDFAEPDAALLERIDAEISQPVPSSFERLAGLLIWEQSGSHRHPARHKRQQYSR